MAMTLRLSDDEQATLERQAAREGVSMQEVVKRAIQQRSAQWDHRANVSESSKRMLAEWADVLAELARS